MILAFCSDPGIIRIYLPNKSYLLTLDVAAVWNFVRAQLEIPCCLYVVLLFLYPYFLDARLVVGHLFHL